MKLGSIASKTAYGLRIGLASIALFQFRDRRLASPKTPRR